MWNIPNFAPDHKKNNYFRRCKAFQCMKYVLKWYVRRFEDFFLENDGFNLEYFFK